jgi:choline kinase
MTNRAVFILAAGDGKRWHRGEEWPQHKPKQLLNIGGETIIGRTVRMVHKRGYDPIVVTHNKDIIDTLAGIEILQPSRRRWLIETLQSTQSRWQDINVALWSDVVYSNAVMDAMLVDNSPIKFYGKWGDGCGLVWRGNNQHMIDGMKAVIEHAQRSDNNKYSVGRSWELYRWFQGWDLNIHIGPTESNEYYELVPYEDYTRDIDTPEDWQAVQKRTLQELNV